MCNLRLRAVVLLAAASLAAACDYDLFGSDRRPVAGPYALLRFESDAYYLTGGPGLDRGGSAVPGPVRRIGWRPDAILVQREDRAWVVVDVRRRAVSPPLTEAAARARLGPAALPVLRADSAWATL